MEEIKKIALEILALVKKVLKKAYDKIVFSICYVIVELIDRILVPFT